MKICPLCNTTYPNEHTTCGHDGAMLIGSRDLEPGLVVRNKYRIVRVLGRGGMGTVYLADHILLGKQRALKFISNELSQDPRFLKRFRLEALAAIELRHPNIVEVADLDQAEDGSPFIAMEYVEGTSLRDALAEAPFPVERALSIARGVGLGLIQAHSRQIIHRDIKPENILLAREGQREIPKILDFGIAAMKESSTAVSRTRGLMLTPEYASPEQWRGTSSDELDGRVDLYALGGVLHEMLTGRTSFHSHNTEGWLYQHLQVIPEAPSRLRPDLARWPGLDELVLQLLEKDRDLRTPSAEEFVHRLDAVRAATPRTRLEQAIAPIPTPAPPPTPPLPRTTPARAAESPAQSYQPPASEPASTAPQPKWLSSKLLLGTGIGLSTAILAFAAWFFVHRQVEPTSTGQTQPTETSQLNSNQPAVEEPQPTTTEQPKPTTTEQPQPTAGEQPKPPATEKPKPTFHEKPKPTAQPPTQTGPETSASPAGQQPMPAGPEESKPRVAEQPAPTPSENTKPQPTEVPKPTGVKGRKSVFIGWVGINSDDWRKLGYSSEEDWLEVIANANTHFQQECKGLSSLSGRNVTVAKDESDAGSEGRDIYIKFSNVQFDRKYRLHVAVHFIDLKSGSEVGAIPLEDIGGHFCSLVSCLDKELSHLSEDVGKRLASGQILRDK